MFFISKAGIPHSINGSSRFIYSGYENLKGQINLYLFAESGIKSGFELRPLSSDAGPSEHGEGQFPSETNVCSVCKHTGSAAVVLHHKQKTHKSAFPVFGLIWSRIGSVRNLKAQTGQRLKAGCLLWKRLQTRQPCWAASPTAGACWFSLLCGALGLKTRTNCPAGGQGGRSFLF